MVWLKDKAAIADRIGIGCAAMDVVAGDPFRVASLVWHNHAGTPALTVVAKATFLLQPGECPLASVQEPPNEEENHWDDDPSRSLYSPSDLVPRKPRADVLLVGSAFTPRREPVRSLLVRLVVGEVDKAIEVFCDRWFTQDGQLREGPRFTKMPLRWERAAGGPGTSNPVGVRLEGPPDPYGNIAIPNLQPPGVYIERHGDFVPPIGFGPLASSWPERRDALGRHRDLWSDRAWADRPLPKDVDRAFFQAAPRDQRVDALRDNERIVLENLHPEHPRLVTSLPGVRPRAIVQRVGAAAQELDMRADTLWIDTDRSICTLSWHMQVRLMHRSEPGQIMISMVRRAGPQPVGAPAAAGVDDDTQTLAPALRPGPAMPFVRGASPLARAGSPAQGTGGRGKEAEEIEEVSADLVVEDEPAPGADAVETMFLTRESLGLKGSILPFRKESREDVAPRSEAPPPPPSRAPLPAAEVALPPLVRPPGSAEPIAPQVKVSPWGGSEGRAGGQTVGESAAAAAVAKERLTPMGQAPPAAGGALAASNAAAGREATRAAAGPAEAKTAPVSEEKAKARPKEVIKLLWFDPKSVGRIRKHAEWRVTLAELELRLLEEGIDEEAEAPDERGGEEPNPKDRRDVFEVLAKGRAIGADGVKLALDEAIGEDGKFEPPLVLLAGELEIRFDELETLKATATALRPLATGDKRLQETLAMVDELLKTPWLQGSGGIAEGLTEKLKEAFAQGKRTLPADYLEAHTERMLLEQRCYEKRTVFGRRWIRSVLRGGGGAVVYVPEALKDELPMFRRFKVKMIGEVDVQEDQYESASSAVKVVALGRVLGG